MPVKFIHRGQEHMVIEPNTHMFNSQTIRDVVDRGGLFGVNLETGKFGIIPEKVVERHGLKLNYRSITVYGSDGAAYTGTVNETGELRFFIQGEWHIFKNIYAFMERV